MRAATRLADRVTAFAPVSSGDPYGWIRDCTPRAGDRVNVFGAAFDNETGRQITEPGACAAAARGYPQTPALRLQGGSRAADWHYWLDAYNQPLLDFFSAQLR